MLERGAYEVRSENAEIPENVESRKLPGTKKWWSPGGARPLPRLLSECLMGIGGTGGTRRDGDAGEARFVTPGM